MPITELDVVRIAELSRIEIIENDIQNMKTQLSNIIEYVDKLNKLDTVNISPTSHVLDIKNVLRDDLLKESLQSDGALLNAPDKTNHFYRVQSIIS